MIRKEFELFFNLIFFSYLFLRIIRLYLSSTFIDFGLNLPLADKTRYSL